MQRASRPSILRSFCLLAVVCALLLPGPAAAAATATATARCGVNLGAPVIAHALAQVPRPRIGTELGRWSATPTSGNFNPCARISGVVIAVEHGTASSPGQVLLFAFGRYVGTAARYPFSGATVDAVAGTTTTLVVQYLWEQWNETVAGSDGDSTAEFRWDGSAVLQAGDLPPLPWVPISAVLTSTDAGLPRYTAGKGVRPTTFEPCGGVAYPVEQHRVAGLWRVFVSEENGKPTEGEVLEDDVVRYGTSVEVVAAEAGYLQAAQECPRYVDGTRTTTEEVLQLRPLIVRETTIDSEFSSSPVAPLYYAFPGVGNLLAIVLTADSEGDIGLPDAQHRARQARTRLLVASSRPPDLLSS